MPEPTIVVCRPPPAPRKICTGIQEAADGNTGVEKQLREGLRQATTKSLQFAEVSAKDVRYQIFAHIFVRPSLKFVRAGVWSTYLRVGKHIIPLYATSSGR